MDWSVVGWLGNACFFSRFLFQWWRSEQEGRSVAPAIFWRLSLAGSVCMSTYTLMLGEPVLLVGNLINLAIYARNLSLGRGSTRLGLPATIGLGLLAAGLLLWTVGGGARADLAAAPLWLGCSVIGQSLWSTRFLVQWLAAEREGESHFPRSFWWISLAGNALLLAYAVHRLDPVLVAGYLLGPIVQIRNLVLGAGSRTQTP